MQTISCLLIHPNPDSALNPMAGSLLQDDYSEFARQARLMTSIHAPVPFVMKQAVLEAKQRGEDPEMAARMENEQQTTQSRQETRTTSLVMKKKIPAPSQEEFIQQSNMETTMDYTDNIDDDGGDDCKENDPSLSPEPVAVIPAAAKRTGPGKRPLSVIPTTPVLDTDIVMFDSASDDENLSCDGMTASERNIAANSSNSPPPSSQNSSVFSEHNTYQQAGPRSFSGLNNNTNPDTSSYAIYEDNDSETINPTETGHRRRSTYGKENITANGLFSTPKEFSASSQSSQETPPFTTGVFMKPSKPSLSSSSSSSSINNSSHKTTATKPFSPMKVTKKPVSSQSGARKGMMMANKGKPRIGLRRL